MDGLREIHFGERSLSLSHLYKNDSRRCIPLLLVAVAVDLFVGLFEPCCCCCCWLFGDVDETLWWELRAPRGDDGPSTSKLEYENRKKTCNWWKTFLIENDCLSISNLHHSPLILGHLFLFLSLSFSGDKNTSVYLSVCTVICIHLHASVTTTWSINESVTTEEDVNIDDEIPKEKRKGRTKKRKYISHASFVIFFSRNSETSGH